MPVLIVVISFIVAAAGVRLAIPLLRRRGAIDRPNARSSHTQPTPRGGGIAIVVGCFAGVTTAWILGSGLPSVPLIVGAVVIAVAGFLDDIAHGLSVGIRLLIQCGAALLVLTHNGGIPALPLPEPLSLPLGLWALPLGLIWMVAVTNIYNFLDGIDGFAGLQAIVAAAAITLLAASPSMVTVGLALIGACGGFLIFNWHPARVFMGDVASATLGFIFAALPFEADLSVRSQVVFVVAISLWPFLSDGTYTLLRRIAAGERFWEPHRSHLYQRLVRTSLRHDQVTLAVIGGGSPLALLAVWSVTHDHNALGFAVLVLVVLSFMAYHRWVRLREAGPLPPRKPTVG